MFKNESKNSNEELLIDYFTQFNTLHYDLTELAVLSDLYVNTSHTGALAINQLLIHLMKFSGEVNSRWNEERGKPALHMILEEIKNSLKNFQHTAAGIKLNHGDDPAAFISAINYCRTLIITNLMRLKERNNELVSSDDEMMFRDMQLK